MNNDILDKLQELIQFQPVTPDLQEKTARLLKNELGGDNWKVEFSLDRDGRTLLYALMTNTENNQICINMQITTEPVKTS